MSLTRLKRYTIFKRSGWRCHYCGAALHPFWSTETHRAASVDHMHPVSKGGTDHESNLVASCRPCNSDKGDIPYLFYLWLREMLALGYERGELLAAIEQVEPEFPYIPPSPDRMGGAWFGSIEQFQNHLAPGHVDGVLDRIADAAVAALLEARGIGYMGRSDQRLVRVGQSLGYEEKGLVRPLPYRGVVLRPVPGDESNDDTADKR